MNTMRHPLLSDEQIREIRSRHDHALSVKQSAYEVRDYYENLITEGKLRVVEEAEAMCGDHGGIEGCSCSKCGAPVSPEHWMFCPGCGNRVKR